jgi:hypothetical protein
MKGLLKIMNSNLKIMKKKRCYRQGIINRDISENLKKGQIVDIISEDDYCYIIQLFITSFQEKIQKQDLNC